MRLFESSQVQEQTVRAGHPGPVLQLATELAHDGSATVPVRALAHYITRPMARVNDVGPGVALWLRQHATYRRETPGYEVLSGPISTVLTGGGDCDDLAILWASLCRAVGVEAYPCAVWRAGAWAHLCGWAAPAPPVELSVEWFYDGRANRTPRFLPAGNGYRYKIWCPRAGGFRDVHPAPHCSACSNS